MTEIFKVRIGAIYYCNRSLIYEFLSRKGFTPAFVKPDFKDNERLVWCFNRTPELLAALNEYSHINNSGLQFIAK